MKRSGTRNTENQKLLLNFLGPVTKLFWMKALKNKYQGSVIVIKLQSAMGLFGLRLFNVCEKF